MCYQYVDVRVQSKINAQSSWLLMYLLDLVASEDQDCNLDMFLDNLSAIFVFKKIILWGNSSVMGFDIWEILLMI